MLFNSIDFLIFFPTVTFVYFILPKKIRYIWLLVCSYYFYMGWNKKYAVLLFMITGITYLTGLLIEKIEEKENTEEKKKCIKRICLGVSIVLNLGILCYFKYLNYFIGILNRILEVMRLEKEIPVMDIILPVGISFYIFQALGYTIDVYRGEIYAERNFLKYALFVSFFPQLVAGPIERSKNLLVQLGTPKTFSYENLRRGFLLMLWGFFLKLVIADRAAMIVDTVYADSTTYYGFYIIIATFFFAIQIYCDFAGYSTIARGAAQVLGFHLTDNFNAPYFSKSIKEFWRRWHISLTDWFRDYLYIPLGGNRKGKVRKEINLLIVFMTSGLWHGSAASYVVWGMLNGIYQIVGDIFKRLKEKANLCFNTMNLSEKTNIENICKSEKTLPEYTNISSRNLLQRITTFFLVSFTWLFFRAGGLGASFTLIRSMLHFNWTVLFDGTLYSLGVPDTYFRVLLASIILLFIVDYKKYMEINVVESFLAQDWWFRVAAEMILIFTILLYGCYGELYDTTQFIYFQF